MYLSTTKEIAGKEVKEHLGLVTAETVYGAHIGRDLLASIRDFVGGRSKTYEKVLADLKKAALEELQERAKSIGADAIVGIKLDFGIAGANGSMMMLNASGTAVKLA